MIDLIKARSEESRCPICNEGVTEPTKIVGYTDPKLVLVCRKHYVEKVQ